MGPSPTRHPSASLETPEKSKRPPTSVKPNRFHLSAAPQSRPAPANTDNHNPSVVRLAPSIRPSTPLFRTRRYVHRLAFEHGL
jgi:hypothetical protein